jgi:hypothetical protein
MMRRLAVLPLLCAALAACSKGTHDGAADQGYARDADTGAAAPATRQDLSPYTTPDSTTGQVDIQRSGGTASGGNGTPARPGGKSAADSVRRKP